MVSFKSFALIVAMLLVAASVVEGRLLDSDTSESSKSTKEPKSSRMLDHKDSKSDGVSTATTTVSPPPEDDATTLVGTTTAIDDTSKSSKSFNIRRGLDHKSATSIPSLPRVPREVVMEAFVASWKAKVTLVFVAPRIPMEAVMEAVDRKASGTCPWTSEEWH